MFVLCETLYKKLFELQHEISNKVVCATSKGSDQTAESLCESFEYFMTLWPLTEHPFEFLSLNRDCTGSSELTHVKIPHSWKLHVTARIY